MSVEVMTAVFKRYPNGGGEMILALALADHAHEDGTHVFPKIKGLAEKTRQSERSVQYQLRRMEEAGWLIRVSHGNGGRSSATEYRISHAWLKGADFASLKKSATDDEKGASEDGKGCNPAQKRVQPVAPANNRQGIVKEPSGIVDAHQPKLVRDRATSLPDGFEPNETADRLAGELGLVVAAELEAFEDHHRANGTTFKDWQAAFRTWLRNSAKFAQRQLSPGRPALARRPPAPESFSGRTYTGGKL